MVPIEGALLDFRRLDELASGESPIHRLDPRVKVLATAAFIGTVVSFHKYDVSALIPFCIFPFFMLGLSTLPPGYIVRKIALLCPLAVAVALFNPFFDREVLVHLGPLAVSGGWVSLVSALIRAIFSVAAALILVGTTGFPAICWALEKMGLPQVFVVQMLFLYRYISVLTEEGARAAAARALRSFGKRGLGMRTYGSLLGHLLLRTWQRAERVHMCMQARGFDGNFRLPQRRTAGLYDLLFLGGWGLVFVLLRLNNLSQFVGNLLLK